MNVFTMISNFFKKKKKTQIVYFTSEDFFCRPLEIPCLDLQTERCCTDCQRFKLRKFAIHLFFTPNQSFLRFSPIVLHPIVKNTIKQVKYLCQRVEGNNPPLGKCRIFNVTILQKKGEIIYHVLYHLAELFLNQITFD